MKKEKMRAYKLTCREVDVLSLALKNRIQYLQGILLLKTGAEREKVAAELYETRLVQIKTSYPGQDPALKDEGSFDY